MQRDQLNVLFLVGAWALGAWLLSAATLAAGPKMRADRVVAYVNEYAITSGEVERAIGSRQLQALRRELDEDAFRRRFETLFGQALDFLIERQLIMDAYQRQEGRIPEWAVDRQVDDIVRANYGGDRHRLIRELADNRMTFDQWRENVVKTSMIVSMMRATAVKRDAAIAPQRVREIYDAHPDRFTQSSRVRLRMIVFSPSDRDLAENVRREALAGKDFAALARQHSRGYKSEEGGDWGWVDLGDLRSELATAARTVEEGGISPLVTTEDELYLLKVEELRSGGRIPFAEAQEEIRRDLLQAEIMRLHKEWIERLRKDAYVKRIEPAQS